MTYTPGDYFVVRTPGFAGRVIRVATRSRVNHAGVIVTADGGTVEMQPRSWRWWRGACVNDHVPADAYIVSPPLRDGQRRGVAALAERYRDVGTRYNWLGLVALYLAQRGVRWRWVLDVCRDSRNLFCSQLVDNCYTIAGLTLFDDGRASGVISPGDLLDVAVERDWPIHHSGRIEVAL